ncbi:MAG: NHLP family bacteriocin export ABC transporter peptidase/permease/ATPase subunit [Oscillospiraceae bacterium]|nr:NHLP family bacteriocin export ABC transporter peptidase/permease/ATPase subunit [Oscillospiraceae bacterium]
MAENAVKKPVSDGVAKVPVVMQMENLECGAACLTMVLSFYGKWLPLERVRTDCGVSRDGSNAKNIILAARSYGFRAMGYKYELEQLRENATFPCIIHWEFNHFVVLCGFRGNKAYINDPARGSLRLSMEELDRGFTGICLEFCPDEGFVPEGRQVSMTSHAKKRLKGMAAPVAFVVFTITVGNLAGIIRSGFARVFMDQLLTGQDPSWLIPFTIGLGALGAVQIILAWLQAVYSLRINGKMAVVGSAEFMWKVLRLPLEFFSQRMAGDIKQRMETNASISGELVNTIAPLFIRTVLMIFYLAVMFRYSVLLTFVGLLSIAADVLVSQIVTAKRVNITRVILRDKGKLNSATMSGIEMIETIKASGAENGFFEKWAGYQAGVNTGQVRYARMIQYFRLIPSAVSKLVNTLVLILGVFLTMRGEFTVGMILAFQGFLSAFTEPANELIGAGETIQELRTDIERVEDVMRYPVDCELTTHISGEKTVSKLSGSVTMRDVTFGYAKLSDPLIEHFDLDLAPGSRVAFVGASGCGKSTLANLISGLYKPWSGEILFDGIPISDIDRAVFTGSVAVVDQDIILFEDTIANNIKMWDSSIEDFEMIMAARDAHIHEDIMQREGGYRYRLTEGGKDLSGGQRQRLEIARVLAQDPTVIILDEATSALDARTEQEVMTSIKDRGATCIVIAHRLSTIRDCDEIIVLDKGKVAERGTHRELMAKNGMYARLVVSE